MRSATEKITALAALDRHAFSAIKNSYEQTGRAKDNNFIDCWFSESTHEKLVDASRKF